MVLIKEEESNNLSDQDSPSPIHLEYNFIINRNSLEDKFFKNKKEEEGGWRLEEGGSRKEEDGSRREDEGERREEEGQRTEERGRI